MYMHYLLSHRLREMRDSMDDQTANACYTNICKNTFILALDGDVDFKPEAIQLLVDRMKKDEFVGAACGRIHPIGSGIYGPQPFFESGGH